MRRWSNHLKTVLLLGALSAILVVAGGALGPGYLVPSLGLALAFNVGAYFFSDRLVLRMHGARELPRENAPMLHQMVAELAHSAGIPAPRLFMIDDDHANAFATGRSPARGVVAVTRGIVELLSPRELRGVLAHEIAHIKNRDILLSTIAAVLAAAVTYLAQALQFSSLFGGASEDEDRPAAGGLLCALAAPLAATLVQLGMSRSREFLADETGARIANDPVALATALQKLEAGADAVPGEAALATASLFIVNPLAGMGRLAGLFATHPSTAARVQRLLALAPVPRRMRPAA